MEPEKVMIETNRLLLRPHKIEDFRDYLSLWKQRSPAGDQAPNAQPLGEEEAWSRLLRLIGHWTSFGFGPFLVLDRMSDFIVGEVGFAHCHRGHEPVYDEVPEAMWRIDHAAQGIGIATEAMRATIGWFDEQHKTKRTVCMIDQSNASSLRLALRLGFHEFAKAIYRENQVVLFERLSGPSLNCPSNSCQFASQPDD